MIEVAKANKEANEIVNTSDFSVSSMKSNETSDKHHSRHHRHRHGHGHGHRHGHRGQSNVSGERNNSAERNVTKEKEVIKEYEKGTKELVAEMIKRQGQVT